MGEEGQKNNKDASQVSGISNWISSGSTKGDEEAKVGRIEDGLNGQMSQFLYWMCEVEICLTYKILDVEQTVGFARMELRKLIGVGDDFINIYSV